MMDEMPTMDVGSPPDSNDPNETMEWWGDALDALRDEMDDWVNAMIGSDCHMEPRYEMVEVEERNSVEVPDGNGGVRMETRTETVEKKRLVGEKKVCNGHYIDVEITSESEKKAVIALAESAGLSITERHGATRFDYRLESE